MPGAISASRRRSYPWERTLSDSEPRASPRLPASLSSAQTFGAAPNAGSGSYAPSISADGTRVAYLYGSSSGSIVVRLYDRTTNTSVTCSSGVTYVGRPKISRDGNFVTFFGTPDYATNGSQIVVPLVFTATTSGGAISGSCAAAFAATATNSTTIWDPSSQPLLGACPGIANGSGGSWKISFADLVARAAPPDGYATEYVCTATPGSGPVHTISTPGGAAQETDISSDGGTIAYLYRGEVDVNGTARTSTGAKCQWPSISGDGTTIAYESDASGGVLSGSNVLVEGAVSGSPLSPYAIATGASDNSGSATHPYLSSDGKSVAFECTSTKLAFRSTYDFGNGGAGGSPDVARPKSGKKVAARPLTGPGVVAIGPYAAQCGSSSSGITSGGQTTILSASYGSLVTNGYPVQVAGNACAFNLASSLSTTFAGAFDSASGSFGSLGFGSYGTGTNVFVVY